MRLFKCFLFWLAGCFFSPAVFSQTDSCQLRISLLTCSPGEELYSLFGHSAIRVVDNLAHTDIVYNYGTFEFDEDFYYNFVLGGDRLQYYLSVSGFRDFMYEYQVFNRSVIEQNLALNCEEKQRLYAALQRNATDAHKYYRYDFLFDNCSTRIRDITEANGAPGILFGNILPPDAPSFRNLIHEYLDKGGQYWSKLGIDLLLGSRMDRKVKNEEAMFLPDYLMKGFDSAHINNQPAVATKNTILQASVIPAASRSWIQPGITALLLLLVIFSLRYLRSPKIAAALNAFDHVFFFALGAIGCLLLFMWFGTDHALCANNYNLLWAFPLHLPVALMPFRKNRFTRLYFGSFCIFYLFLIFAWALLPQGMNPAFLPIVALAGIRSYERFSKTGTSKKGIYEGKHAGN